MTFGAAVCPTSTAVAPALIRWPEDAVRRAACAEAGQPCLLLVQPGATIPPLADGEDWIYRTSDERDVAARLRALVARARPVAAGSAPVVPEGLGPDHHRAAARLFASVGSLVHRDDLPLADLDQTIAELGGALGPEGWTIHQVGRAGFVLERTPA